MSDFLEDPLARLRAQVLIQHPVTFQCKDNNNNTVSDSGPPQDPHPRVAGEAAGGRDLRPRHGVHVLLPPILVSLHLSGECCEDRSPISGVSNSLQFIAPGLLPLVPCPQPGSPGDYPVADPDQRRHQPDRLHGVQHGLQACDPTNPAATGLLLLQSEEKVFREI